MAGVVMHLAVADRAAEMLKIKEPSLFFAGNIAPDCVHARKDYNRLMKKHTHLRDGISDWDFLREEMISLFHKRMNKFVEHYCQKGNKQELYLGYLSHLVTDEMFIRTIREGCVTEAQKYGISQRDSAFFGFMMRELNWSDSFTAKNYHFTHDPVRTAEKGQNCNINGFVSADEIKSTVKWIDDNYFSGKNTFEPALYMNPDRIFSFIELSASEAVRIIENIVKNES